MVFLHTGNRIKAMFSFKVSAEPLAKHTQCPRTSYTALCLYWIYLYVKRMAITVSHRAITQILCQLSNTKNINPRYHLFNGLGSSVGLSLSLIMWLSFFLSSLFVIIDCVSSCRSNVLRLSICFKFNINLQIAVVLEKCRFWCHHKESLPWCIPYYLGQALPLSLQHIHLPSSGWLTDCWQTNWDWWSAKHNKDRAKFNKSLTHQFFFRFSEKIIKTFECLFTFSF